MISRILAHIHKDDIPLEITGLRGSSGAYLLHQAQKQMRCCAMVIAAEPQRAEILHKDLFFFEKARIGNAAEPTEILFLPSWETLPFDGSSPYVYLQSKRIETLWRMASSKAPFIVVTSIAALIQRIVSRSFLRAAAFHRAVGDFLDRDEFAGRLIDYGYNRVGLVEEKGDFSVRGGIIDFYPPSSDQPFRVELIGDRIESIRCFDPETQRSVSSRARFYLLPMKEIPCGEKERTKAGKVIQQHAIRLGWPIDRIQPLIESLEQGTEYPGMEYLLPFFHEHLETLFDYMPRGSLCFIESSPELEGRLHELWEEIKERYEAALDSYRLCPVPEALYIPADQISTAIERIKYIYLNELELFESSRKRAYTVRIDVESNESLREPLKKSVPAEEVVRSLASLMQGWTEQGMRLHFASATVGQAERLKALFEGYGLELEIIHEGDTEAYGPYRPRMTGTIHIGELSAGFRAAAMDLVIITEEEIFGPRLRQRRPYRYRAREGITSFEDLRVNDFVVHVDHGIGLFKGLFPLEIDSVKTDFLLIEYLGKDKLYVPVDRLNMIQRYIGSEGYLPRLDRLGTKGWERKKRKAEEAIRKIANELIRTYAARAVLKGHAFSPPDRLYEAFEKAFEYEETPDQKSTVMEVLEDMEKDKPMDRLICGDVGYGKTEVAMRAAFKAAMDSKQVAVLVPTTILAEQHYQTFMDRFRGFPVFIEVISRFKSPREQKEILKRLAEGKIDIIIGTHRLLQHDVNFKDLALLIIDEEQRFGVRHKETLKKMKELVDVLTLTATPIPRTLHMSLVGIRDLSVINTPPPDRLAIRTYISRFDRAIIEEAILREIQRGGQVFFVHNRVKGIEGIARYLKKLVPSARFGIAHGQLKGHELERVMMDFIQRRIDVLVCTNIIQSGLDIPTANTIIINHAERLGLSEMHQIRGRVGRSGHRAYAYFLIPRGIHRLSEVSRKRLRALQEFSELGAGFQIATRDLEIRGAGTLLGVSQSGHIDTIGFEMYTMLMEEAVAELKGKPVKKEIEPEIRLSVPAYLPDSYVPAANQRLVLYKRAASLRTAEELEDFKAELIDRYGPLGTEGNNLIELLKIKNISRALGIRLLQMKQGELVIDFDSGTGLRPEGIVRLVMERQEQMRLAKDNRLVVDIDRLSPPRLFRTIEELLRTLAFHGNVNISDVL